MPHPDKYKIPFKSGTSDYNRVYRICRRYNKSFADLTPAELNSGNFQERTPPAYAPEELERFQAACLDTAHSIEGITEAVECFSVEIQCLRIELTRARLLKERLVREGVIKE